MANPLTFLQQLRTEIMRVTWPTRSEALVTTVMVVIITVILSAFFFLSDQVLNWAMKTILSIRG